MSKTMVLVLCLMATLVGPVALAAPPQAPESVLTMLEEAYGARDIDAYAALLAPDFEFVSREGTGWDADSDIAATRNLFANATEVVLALTRQFSMEPLSMPDTWALRGAPTRLTTRVAGSEILVEGIATLYVRRSPVTGQVQIYKWVDGE